MASSDSENEELRSSGEMMQMRAQIGAATALNCAALALSQVCGGVLGYSDSSSDEEVVPGPGRGAPGRKRRKADIYGDPDGSIIARDILALRSDPDNELLLKKFRFAYRVPWSVFEVRACTYICTVLFLYRFVSVPYCDSRVTTVLPQELVTIANTMPYQASKKPRTSGRKIVSVEILVGASLRHLGKGHDFEDTLYRESFVSGSFLLKFHHRFMEALGDPKGTFFKRHVYWPDAGSEEFKKGLQVYAALGMPGCVASVDGTHVPFEKVPERLRSWYVQLLPVPLGFAVPCRTCTVPYLYPTVAVPSRTCTVPYLYRTVAVPYRACTVPYLYHPVAVPYRRCTVPSLYLTVAVPYPPCCCTVAGPYRRRAVPSPDRTVAVPFCHCTVPSLLLYPPCCCTLPVAVPSLYRTVAVPYRRCTVPYLYRTVAVPYRRCRCTVPCLRLCWRAPLGTKARKGSRQSCTTCRSHTTVGFTT